MWGDISFLSHWMDKVKNENVPGFPAEGTWHGAVKRLIHSGQLELVGGGWVSHDELLTTSHSAVVNLQEGHSYIRESFGSEAVPKIGWQIDPFGHSAATPRVYAAMGYKAMVLGRPDWRMRDAMESDKTLEFWWGSDAGMCSPSLSSRAGDDASANTKLFTHMLHTHYQAPDGFDFGFGHPYKRRAQQVAQWLAAALVSDVKERRTKFRTNHVLVLVGDDFRFQHASDSFEPLDDVIQKVNAGTAVHGVHVQYSVPTDYFAAVGIDGFVAQHSLQRPASAAAAAEARETFPCHEGHLLPYEDKPFDNNWSGFYSSRPVLKMQVRQVESLVRAATVLNVVMGGASLLNATKDVSQSLALVHHHDAITGTCTDVVAEDYSSILDATQASAGMHISSAAKHVGSIAAEKSATIQQKGNCKQLTSESGNGGDTATTFACRLGLANALAHAGQAGTLVEVSVADLSAGRKVGSAHAVAKDLRNRKRGNAEDREGAIERVKKHAAARVLVRKIEAALRVHRWSCVLKDVNAGGGAASTAAIMPSQVVNGRGTMRHLDQEAAEDELWVALQTTVSPWSVSGFTVYLGDPRNAPSACRQHRFASKSTLHDRTNSEPVVLSGRFKRIAMQFDPRSHSGMTAAVTSPLPASAAGSTSGSALNITTTLHFTTHEYTTYSRVNIFGQTGSGHYIMKSAVTIFLKPMLFCVFFVIIGYLVGAQCARSGRLRLDLQLPPAFASAVGRRDRLQSTRRKGSGNGASAWLCCVVNHALRRPSSFRAWGAVLAAVCWGTLLGCAIMAGLLAVLPNEAVSFLAGEQVHSLAGLLALGTFVSGVCYGGFVAGIGMGHVAPLRGLFGLPFGLVLGGAAMLFGRPDLHAREVPASLDLALTVERGPLLSRLTWRPRGLKANAPVSHTLTLVHGAATARQEVNYGGGGSGSKVTDTDDILLDHNVACKPNTELIFRIRASESSVSGSSSSSRVRSHCSWREDGGRRRVLVDNGLEAEPHEIDPWALLPRNHFAAVGFASISGGRRSAADLPTAVSALPKQLLPPPPPRCTDVLGSATSAADDSNSKYAAFDCGMTLHTQQALGVASVGPGTLDVVLHRRLMQADEKGISEILNDNDVARIKTKLDLFEQPRFEPAAVAAGNAACSACMVAAKRRRTTLQFSQGLTMVVPPSSADSSAASPAEASPWKQCASAWTSAGGGVGGGSQQFRGLGIFEVLSVQMAASSSSSSSSNAGFPGPPRYDVLLHLLEPPGCTPASELRIKIAEAEAVLANAIGQCARDAGAHGGEVAAWVAARIV